MVKIKFLAETMKENFEIPTVYTEQQCLIENTFKSISRLGLVPLQQIPKEEVVPTSVTQVQAMQGSICVNFLNLKDATPNERELALQLAVYE